MMTLPGWCDYHPVRARRPGSSRRARAVLIWLGLALILAACRSTGPTPPVPAAAVKVAVEADGIYEVSAASLKAAGFDLATVRPEDLRLTNNGSLVAFMLEGQGQRQALRFYGRGPDRDAYSNQNIYWLSRRAADEPAQTPITSRPANPPDGDALSAVAAASVVSATAHVEEEHQYNSQSAMISDRWVWQTIFAPADVEVKIMASHATRGESLLQLRVIGISSAPVDPDHHLILALNGVQVADARWDGLGDHTITATIPAGIVRAGENSLAIHAPGDTGAPADSTLLDWVELTYPQELTLDRDDLVFGGRVGTYALHTSSEPAALWDITDPAQPVALTGYSVKNSAVQFVSDGSPRRFVAATGAGLRKPAAIVPAASSLDDWPGGADMIIVTVPKFHDALKPLVDARQAQGLRVALVDVNQVYDSFSYGQPGPAAIRTLVRHARDRWTPPAPRYLLLAGDASYDSRGYLKDTELDLVPTQEINTTFSGWTASDVWFGLADNDPAALPDIAVGRFPAQTADQLAAMVGKALDYERVDQTAAWRRQAFLVTDGSDPAFAAAATDFTHKLNTYTTSQVASQGDGSAARQELLRAFDAGAGLVGYFGHGSVTIWAKEKVFSVEDVAKLANRDKLPVVFTVTCLSGFFQHPNTPSLGETLLRAENGGAAAAVVPSSAAVLTDQRVLVEGLAAALNTTAETDAPKTLGDILLQAQRSVSDTSQGLREVLLTFNLLGDPAMTLPR